MSQPVIAHPPGISKTIFAISLIIVAVVSGLGGYFVAGYFKTPPPSVTLNGAGATFPYPFISSVGLNYSRTHQSTQVNYNPQGSGFGIAQLTAKTVDFAATDAPLSDAQRAAAPNSVHIPETIGAVVVAYNLGSSFPTGLNLTAAVIAKIFQANITMWNDNAIQTLNPGLAGSLPPQAIKIVHRADGSGTTFIFTKYLAYYSQGAWVLGNSTNLGAKWPGTSLGANGNQGVAGVVQGTTYTVGYVELNYALQNNMKIANVRTPSIAGNFIKPTLQNVIYALNNASATQTLPTGDASWSTVTLLNATGTSSYPIVSFTYLLVYKELNVNTGMSLDKAKALVDFLWFVVHDGQALAPGLYYAQLPTTVVTIDENTIRSITFNGQTLRS